MPYQHVIFDFDGVVCDSLTAAIHTYNRLRQELFPFLPPVSSQSDMEVVYAGSLRTCLHRWLSEEEAKHFFDLHSAGMAAIAPTLPVFPGVAEIFRKLGNRSSSIVTSAYSDAVLTVLARDPSFASGYLYKVAGRELVQTKTEKIKSILSSLGLGCGDAVYVGDLESDILYCRAVPIDIVAVGYGYHSSGYLRSQKPTYLVDSVGELHDLLCCLCGRTGGPVHGTSKSSMHLTLH